MNHQEKQKAYGKIVAKAWADPGFKERLLTDPLTVLKEHGFEFPEGAEVKALENTNQLFYFVLPAAPEADALQMEEHDERLAACSIPGAY